MRVIISDAPVLIDLAKAQLIEPALRLPYEFVIPDVMVADELVEFGCLDRDTLSKLGLKQGMLDGDGVSQALRYFARDVSMSTNECFALVLAETTPGAILLTGNQACRTIAEQHQIAMHGVLWLIDQIHKYGCIDVIELRAAMVALEAEPLVRLPRQELRRRIALMPGS